MTIPQSAILWMADLHLGIWNSVLKWLRPRYTELMWFYCNDNVAKRDFQSQTAYSQFGVDIVKRSGIIYYKWPNIKRESLDASIIWFWTNSQGTGDWDVMTHMCVTVMPMLQNAISQTPHLGMNNLRPGIICHKQLNVVFIQLFVNRWFIINSMFLKWFARNFEHIVKCYWSFVFGNAWREGHHFYFHVPQKMRDISDIVPEIVKITLLRFRYQWPKDPMNDKSATVSQSQGRHKHANGEREWYQ